MAAFLGPLSSLPHPVQRRIHLSHSQQPRQQQPPPPAATTPVDPSLPNQQQQPKQKPPASPGESTDWIASSLSRRFGLGAGLAWAAFLAVGVVSEQIKTRLENSQQEATTRDVDREEEVLLPNGIRYYEMRVGGGGVPSAGDLVVIDLKGRVKGSGEVFIDTFGEGKKPLALVVGSRPYTKGMCEGVEYVLRRMMKAGGKARVIVPPSLGFGDQGADLGEGGVQIPPSSTLEFIVQVDKVSIAPA